jgi:hypothetical protein
MSFQKIQIKRDILRPVEEILEKTIADNDYTGILNSLNCILDIYEEIDLAESEMLKIWNDIISDIIGAIHSASSGFYRLALISLRSTLELACSSFYYIDHKIEYFMYQSHNLAADKYVSTLVNQHYFFTTKYIESFNQNINLVQSKEDSISTFLKSLYGDLCDIVHGRFNTLTKANSLSIKYNKELFKRFEKFFNQTLSIIAVMFILRFDKKTNQDVVNLANFCKVVNI